MDEWVVVQAHENCVVITLNRPKAYNSFNLEMITRLTTALTELAADDAVRCVVLTGQGTAFCAGGDLKWAVELERSPGAAFHILAAQFHQGIVEIRRMRKPVIAAINGIAAGGGFSLALACDFRIMARSAVLRQGYTSSGLCIDGGGTFTLPRLVGAARALEIAAFDAPISSDQALEWGLVTQVAEDAETLDEAIRMAQRLAKTSLHSFAWSKRLINDSFANDLEVQLESERQGLSNCARHPDGQEGLRAFIDKRKPKFD